MIRTEQYPFVSEATIASNERLLSEEAKFGSDARWIPYLQQERRRFKAGMDDDRLTTRTSITLSRGPYWEPI